MFAQVATCCSHMRSDNITVQPIRLFYAVINHLHCFPRGKKKYSVISSHCTSWYCMFTEILSKRNILKEVPFLPLLSRPQTPCPLMLPKHLQHSYHSSDNTAHILHCTVFTSFKKSFFCVMYFLPYCAASVNIPISCLLMLQQKQVFLLSSSCVRRKMTASEFTSGY